MKNKIMQTATGTILGLLMLVGSAQIFASGQSDGSREPGIVGVYRTTVTQRNCQTGNPIATFQGLSTFNKGGTMTETSTALSPALRSPGHGVWQRGSGSQYYSFAFTFLRFNLDGTFAGTQVIRQWATLAPDDNQYNATGYIEVYNASGNLLGTGCATAVATRFE
jgi:hypothetical protein